MQETEWRRGLAFDIRSYSPETSLDAVVELVNGCYSNSPSHSRVTVADLEQLMTRAGFRPELLLTAYACGRAVGVCLAFHTSGEQKASLRWLGVLPAFRRNGIGRTMLDCCVKSVKPAGAREVSISVDAPVGLGVARFLESQGFREDFVQLLMVRDLALPFPEAHLPEPYRIRPIRSSEEEAWLRVRNEAFREEGIANRQWGIGDFRREFLENPLAGRGRIFVAEYQGEVVGVVAAWFSVYRGLEREIAHWLAVLPQHRRKGIGQALIVEVLRFFNARGAKEVRLMTQSLLPNAVRLYGKLGFMVEVEQPVYLKPIE